MLRWLVVVVLMLGGCPKAAEQPPAEQEPVENPAPPLDWKKAFDEWTYPDPIPPFELTDHTGKSFRLDAHDDAYLLVGFIFTSCPMPEACPLTMKKMREVQQLWAEREKAGTTGGKKLQLLSLTLDPTNDTPDKLAQYGRTYGAEFSSWRLATGSEELMKAIPSLFNVLALPDGEGSIRHTVKVALLRPGRNDFTEWTNNKFEAADIVAKILEDDLADAAK